MKLNRTEEILRRKVSTGEFDTYAVLAGRGEDVCALFSDNTGWNTLFDIASMGKVLVTSTLILKAAGEGRLALDDRLDQYFENVPQEKAALTIRQLLTHTSGIVRFEFPAEVASESNDEIAARILERPFAYQPDTDYRYSCHGYVLLGFIVEKVYGAPLGEVFEQHLKRPLGLTRSSCVIPADTPDAAVTHYRAEAGGTLVADNNVRAMKRAAGNGASFWTLKDIHTFVKAVLNRSEALYSGDLFELAEKNYTPEFAEGRGLGYLVVDEKYPQTGELFAPGAFGHCGNTGTSFFMDRRSGHFAVILTNAMRFSYMRRNFVTADYSEVMNLRAELHNAICEDMKEQGILK